MNRVEHIGDATLYLGDCREILPTLPKVDHLVTDPPYDVEAHTLQRRTLGVGISRSRKFENAALPFAPLVGIDRELVCSGAARQCEGWFLAFCQAESVGAWREAMTRGGARWRRAGVWVKPDSAPQLSGDRPACGHEAIAISWCGRGRSHWNGGGSRGVWTFPKHDPGFGHGGSANTHPTQKPLVLMRKLVSDFTQAGETVCDLFMGSGTTGVACANLGRKFIGIEIEPKYFDIACSRIDAAYRQGRLFV